MPTNPYEPPNEREYPTATPSRIHTGWFALALLAALVGIEFAFPAWSRAQMYALGIAIVFFGSITAWRRIRHRVAARKRPAP